MNQVNLHVHHFIRWILLILPKPIGDSSSLDRVISGPRLRILRKSIHRILLALDASKRAQKASKLAIDLAKSLNVRLVVAYVVPKPRLIVPPVPVEGASIGVTPAMVLPIDLEESTDALCEIAQKKLTRTVAKAKRRNIKARGDVLRSDSIAKTILTYANRQRADLIIVGTRPAVGIKKILSHDGIGDVVKNAPCPVIVP